MKRPARPKAHDLNEARDDLAEHVEAEEQERWCLDFYGPHTHRDIEPFRPARSPWWPAEIDFPALGERDRFSLAEPPPDRCEAAGLEPGREAGTEPGPLPGHP